MSLMDKIKSWFGGGKSAPTVAEPPAKKKTATAKPTAKAEPAEVKQEEPKPPEADA